MATPKPRPMTAAQRARASQRRRDNANSLYYPGRKLTGAKLKGAANQLTDAELKPQIKSLERTNADAQRQGTALAGNVSGYYGQLAQQEAGNYDRQRAITDRLRANLAATNAATDSNIATAAQQAAAQEEAVLADRGGLGGGSGAAAAEAVAARARAASVGQSALNTAALTGASSETNADAMQRVSGMRGGEAQQRLALQVANQLAEGRNKIADLEGTRGGVFIKNLTELGQSRFENNLTGQQFGLDKKQLEEDRKARDREVNEWGYTAAEWRKLKPSQRQQLMRDAAASGTTGSSPDDPGVDYGLNPGEWANMTQDQRVAAKNKWEGKKGSTAKEPDRARAIKRNVDNGTRQAQGIMERKGWRISPDAPKAERDAMRRRLAAAIVAELKASAKKAREPFFPPKRDELSAALDMAVDGHVSKKNRNRLREQGVRVPGYWRPQG